MRGGSALGRVRGLLVTLVLVLQLTPPAESSASGFEIEAPPELASEAARLAVLGEEDLTAFQELLGWEDGGRAIRVFLMPEDSPLARQVPRWVAGFAQGRDDLIVLFPDRVPSYPYSSFTELVRHERAHVMIDRAAGGGDLPRWFHEGLAMMAEGGWQMNDRSRLAMAMLRSGEPELDELSPLFSGGEPQVAWAYAVSGAFVRDLIRRGESEMIANLLAEMRDGAEFRSAFESVVGVAPEGALGRFWRRTALWYRWLPIVTSSTVLWIGISLLAVLAIYRRRARDRALLEAWEDEERVSQVEAEDLIN